MSRYNEFLSVTLPPAHYFEIKSRNKHKRERRKVKAHYSTLVFLEDGVYCQGYSGPIIESKEKVIKMIKGIK